MLHWLFWPRVPQEGGSEVSQGGVRSQDLLRASPTWLGSGCKASLLLRASPWDCSSVLRTWQLAAPRVSGSEARESQVEAMAFLGSSLGGHSLPSATVQPLLVKTSYQVSSTFQGEQMTLCLFKGGVPKNLWSCLKQPCLVGCGATAKRSSPGGKFYQPRGERV